MRSRCNVVLPCSFSRALVAQIHTARSAINFCMMADLNLAFLQLSLYNDTCFVGLCWFGCLVAFIYILFLTCCQICPKLSCIRDLFVEIFYSTFFSPVQSTTKKATTFTACMHIGQKSGLRFTSFGFSQAPLQICIVKIFQLIRKTATSHSDQQKYLSFLTVYVDGFLTHICLLCSAPVFFFLVFIFSVHCKFYLYILCENGILVVNSHLLKYLQFTIFVCFLHIDTYMKLSPGHKH